MILDKVFNGILDQGAGCLIVFDEPEVDVRPPFSLPSLPSTHTDSRRNLWGFQQTYDDTLETIGHVSQVVEQLYSRTRTAAI